MKRDKLTAYRRALEALHQRVGDEVNHVVESIHEDVDINHNNSSAPVHLADVAEEAVDADIEVLHTTRSMLDEIDTALARIEAGTFGECAECGGPIAQQRLKAIPFTAVCVRCAKSGEPAVHEPAAARR